MPKITEFTSSFRSSRLEDLGFDQFHRRDSDLFPTQISSVQGFLGDFSVTTEQVETLKVDRLMTGTIYSKQITLGVTPNEGDSYIALGKTDFNDTTNGFIFGLDDSDSDSIKLNLGNGTNYIDWNVTTPNTLTIAGSVYISSGSTIAGFEIGTDYIRDVANTFGLASTVSTTTDLSIVNTARAVSLNGTTGLTMIQNANADDANILVTLPFSVTFNSIAYTNVYVGSNGYLTFGTGSSAFSGLSASNPAIPGIHINAGDRSYQRVYKGSLDGNATYIIRYEGAVGTSGTPGASTVFWEVKFTAATPDIFLIDIGSNAASGLGTSGITSGSAYIATFGSGTVNQGYTLDFTYETINPVDDIRYWAGAAFADRASATSWIKESGAAKFSSITLSTNVVLSGLQAGSSVDGQYLASLSVVAASIANATITGAKIASATITGSNIASATIAGSNIASASITSDHIVNATITGTDIASATIAGSNIASATITGSLIASATITGSNIASATITGSNIGSATITGTNIANTTIAAGNIISGTITTTQIASGTIVGSNIASATITGSNIAGTTITASNITALTITASEIANLTINGAKISAAAISPDKTNVPVFILTGTFTDNSPGAGSVAWTSAIVYYNGTANTITNSNSSARYIIWDSTAPTAISGSATVPTVATTWLIGMNNSGTFLKTWDMPQIHGEQIQSATITGTQIASATITATNITAATITATQIANGTITGTQIASATIAAANIVSGTITSTQIASATITGSNIASGTITSDNITNATITGSDIALATITAANITNATITTTQISGTAGITGSQIANTTITSANIANATITTSQISGTANITGGQIAGTTITAANIANNTITSTQIANATITTTQISGTAGITGSQIANTTISAANITNATITTTQISATAGIVGGQIANTTITAANIVNATITGTQIATGTITATNITALTITAAEIANLTISTGKVADLAITNAKINDLAVSKLTAGTISSKSILLAVSDTTGDVEIRAGIATGDFANAGAASGFIFGLDDSDSNLAKFYWGSPTKNINFDGSTFNLTGVAMNTTSTINGTTALIVEDEATSDLNYGLYRGYAMDSTNAATSFTQAAANATITRYLLDTTVSYSTGGSWSLASGVFGYSAESTTFGWTSDFQYFSRVLSDVGAVSGGTFAGKNYFWGMISSGTTSPAAESSVLTNVKGLVIHNSHFGFIVGWDNKIYATSGSGNSASGGSGQDLTDISASVTHTNFNNYKIEVVHSSSPTVSNSGFLRPTANDDDASWTNDANAYDADTNTSATGPANGAAQIHFSFDGGATWTQGQLTGISGTVKYVLTVGGQYNTFGRTWTAANFSDANFQVRLSAVSANYSLSVPSGITFKTFGFSTGTWVDVTGIEVELTIDPSPLELFDIRVKVYHTTAANTGYAKFYVNETLLATHTASLPSGGNGPSILFSSTQGNNNSSNRFIFYNNYRAKIL